MKYFTLIIMGALFSANAVYAQVSEESNAPPTLFNNIKPVGGYGGPIVGTTTLLGKEQILLGGGGGATFGQFSIGGAGYVIGNNIDTNFKSTAGNAITMNMGYGGVVVGYQTANTSVVQFSLSSLFGVGAISLREDATETGYGFTISEPSVALIINVARHFRIKTSLSQRFIANYSANKVVKSDLEDQSIMIHFQFGKFF